ncbi:MAG: sialate O-acetylesterase [Clostridia bacterium]|nr:sialate O-acetylesterase [Clostridia bacterium]
MKKSFRLLSIVLVVILLMSLTSCYEDNGMDISIKDRLSTYKDQNYDIILVCGESNAQGRGIGSSQYDYVPEEEVQYLNEDLTISIADEFYLDGLRRNAFYLSFAQRYLEHGLLGGDRKLLIVNTATAGAGFCNDKWLPDAELFDYSMELIKTLLVINDSNRMVGVLWHQGEIDTVWRTSQSQYEQYLSTLISEIRRELSMPTLAFICGDMCPQWKALFPHSSAIALAQQGLATEGSMIGFVQTDGLYSNDGVSDQVHFSKESNVELGHRYFDEFVRVLRTYPTVDSSVAQALQSYKEQEYDIILVCGQSNAVGRGIGPAEFDYIVDSRIVSLGNNYVISTATEVEVGGFSCNSFSHFFAKLYANNDLESGRKLLIINTAVSETGFSDNRWCAGCDLYESTISKVKAVLGLNPHNRLVAVLWHQGERDITRDVNRWVYFWRFDNMLKWMRLSLNAVEVPFIAGDFSTAWKQNYVASSAIVQAIKDVVSNNSHCGFVTTREEVKVGDTITVVQVAVNEGDVMHFSKEGNKLLGQKYYSVYRGILAS